MKKHTKRVLALAVVMAILCSMTAFANTAAITKVEILDTTGTNVLWSYDATELETAEITVDPSNLVKVTAKITDESDDDAAVSAIESTFLSHKKDETELNDTNIMFVDQKTTNESGEAVYTFRPRAGESFLGNYVAKTGGEGVAVAADKSYAVGEASVDWSIAAVDNQVEADATEALTYSFTINGGAVMPTVITVKIDGTAIQTYEYSAANKTLSITGYNSTNDTDAEVTHSVTVEAAGYNTLTTNYVVAVKQVIVIPPEDMEEVEDGVKDAIDAVPTEPEPKEDGTFEVVLESAAIEGTDYNVTYSIKPGSGATYSGGKISWDPNAAGAKFAERVTVIAKVGDVEQEKDIYLVKPGTEISFGNALAIASGTDCAFETQEGLKDVTEQDELEIRAKVLNIVFNGLEAESVAQPDNTLDYNRDDKVTLGEYYIIKRMLDEKNATPVHAVYNVEKVKNSRPAK